jgi:hypothetical protein
VRPLLLVTAALCVVLLAGCGSSSSEISASDVKSLVLKPADLPAFQAFADGPTSSLDVQGTARANLERFGREGGWVERLRRAAGAKHGLVLVVSTVDVFKDKRGAAADLNAYRGDFARQRANGLAQRVLPPRLGDGAVAARLVAPGGEGAFAIAWTERNASASVTAFGLGKVTLGDVAALARKQQAKLSSA